MNMFKFQNKLGEKLGCPNIKPLPPSGKCMRRQIEDIFSYFYRKQDLTFHANCNLRKMPNPFSWIKKEDISKDHLLKFNPPC